MKIGIVEDHKLLRSTYKMILKDFECNLTAGNGNEMIEQLKTLGKNNVPDIFIVDINMPEMDGFETVKWLKSNYPHVKIIVITMQNDDRTILRMIKLGVNSFLTKFDLLPEEIIVAIDEVLKKGNYYSNKVTEVLVKSYQNDNMSEIEAKIQSITEKELCVLKLICEESTSAEIAEKMEISLRTVETIVRGLLLKLKVKTRVGLAVFAQKHGFFNN